MDTALLLFWLFRNTTCTKKSNHSDKDDIQVPSQKRALGTGPCALAQIQWWPNRNTTGFKSWLNHMRWFDLTTRRSDLKADLDLIWIHHHFILDFNKSQVSVSYIKLLFKAYMTIFWCHMHYVDRTLTAWQSNTVNQRRMHEVLDCHFCWFWVIIVWWTAFSPSGT